MSETKRRLMLWGVGVETSAGAGTRVGPEVVVLEEAAHLAALRDSGVVTTGATVFAPGGEKLGDEAAGIVRYGGNAGLEGTEIALGYDFYLQVLRYAVSQYMSVVGPTLVRIADDGDLAVFLQDADRARVDGEFPPFLTNPLVHLADIPALGAPWRHSGPSQRLHVTAEGWCSTSPAGLRLGTVGATQVDLLGRWNDVNAAAELPCAVSLGGVVTAVTRVQALRERPWLPQYLNALHLLREATARGISGLQVSGFGRRLTGDELLDDRLSAAADRSTLVIAWSGERALIHDPRTRRTLEAARQAAELVEVLLALGGVGRAAMHRPREALQYVEAQLARHGMLPTASATR